MADGSEPFRIEWDRASTHVGPSVNAMPSGSTLGRVSIDAPAWRWLFVRPSFASQCDGPLETTRRLWSSADDAAGVLDEAPLLDWGSKTSRGHLQLEAFRVAVDEPGAPWVADGVLHPPNGRCLAVSIAILALGNERCGIEIRPGYRRPWSRRLVRRHLRSTHAAADRIRDAVVEARPDDPDRRRRAPH